MKCLGCGKPSKHPQAENWKLWQLCYACGLARHPEFYKDKPRHGTGGTWMKQAECIPLTTPVIK